MSAAGIVVLSRTVAGDVDFGVFLKGVWEYGAENSEGSFSGRRAWNAVFTGDEGFS